MKHPQIAKISRLFVRLAAVLAILATSLFMSAAPAQSAAGINRYVSPGGTDAADCSNPNEPCGSIQYALDFAASGDVILLDAGIYEERVLISKSITIEQDPDAICNNSPCVTIDGGQNGRVIDITPYDSVVRLKNITIANGQITDQAGAGIRNYGHLTMDGVTVRNNVIVLTNPNDYNNYPYSGGGIVNNNELTMSNSNVYSNSGYNGGGIYHPTGTLIIENSEIYDNMANYNGGGISIPWEADSTIDNTTIWGNTAGGQGGGVYISDDGHIAIDAVAHLFRNVTISGNLAGSTGGLYSSVQVVLSHCTLAMNNVTSFPTELYLKEEQARIANRPHSEIYSTIITNPAVEVGLELCSIFYNESNPYILSGGGNVAGDESCHLNFIRDIQNADPRLLPLGENGGPVQTHALPPRSLAIDRGYVFHNGFDARGISTQDGDFDGDPRGDSGAYEFDPLEVYLPLVIR